MTNEVKRKNDAGLSKEEEAAATALVGVGIGIGGALFTAFTILWGGFWSGLAGWQLWQWFMIPMGAPDISGWQIAGLGLLLRLLAPKPATSTDNSGLNAIWQTYGFPVMFAILTVCAGWLFAKMAGLA